LLSFSGEDEYPKKNQWLKKNNNGIYVDWSLGFDVCFLVKKKGKGIFFPQVIPPFFFIFLSCPLLWR
jgi:hypothetical protein